MRSFHETFHVRVILQYNNIESRLSGLNQVQRLNIYIQEGFFTMPIFDIFHERLNRVSLHFSFYIGVCFT